MSRGWGLSRGHKATAWLPIAVSALILISLISAITVTISNSPYADSAGILLQPYYENRNAPITGCTSPCLTVDTQTTQPNPSSGTLAIDGNAGGLWSSGTSFTITATTTNPNDVIVLWIVTRLSGSSITVTSISDSQAGVTWQSSARLSYVACSGAQLTTQTEWYGIAALTLTSDVITVNLSGTPTSASGAEFGVRGANTASPFDTNVNVPKSAISTCTATGAAPTVSAVSTTNPNDFVFALYGGFTSTTETAGVIAGTTATLVRTQNGLGRSYAVEYRIVSAAQSSVSCAFGTSTTFWGIVCDAIVQASGSFSLSGGSNMYLWSPQFSSSATIPAGAVSVQLFADLPAPALDGSASGTWSSGNSFTVGAFSTTQSNDVVIAAIETYVSGSSITVSSITDSQSKVTWQGSARSSFISCSGTQESTHIEWYGIAATSISADTVTINLGATPTSASGIVFGVSAADTTTPFDPAAGLPKTGLSACTATATAPTVSAVTTVADTDFVFALFGGYTSVTETAGAIAGTTGTLVVAVAGTGSSNAVEYRAMTTSQSSTSCAFGTSTTYWGVLCDALMPARQSITVSYATTNSAGTVQSTMIAGSSATITAVYQAVTISSSTGTIPASGYVRVIITAPTGVALTIFWGYGKPTEFQVSYTYQT